MVVISGIDASVELQQLSSTFRKPGNVRFIKLIIQNESLVSIASIETMGSPESDLAQLDTHLDDAGYILIHPDDPYSKWLVVSYVPDTSPVKDKMLYASTRLSVTNLLGSNASPKNLVATSRNDIAEIVCPTPQQQPVEVQDLNSKEREMAEIKSAEKAEMASRLGGYRAKPTLAHGEVGFDWTPEAKEAVEGLTQGEESHIVVMQIDKESLVLSINSDVTVDNLATLIPESEPSFSLFYWQHCYSTAGNNIVFIYSCPSPSSVKSRMLYSIGVLNTFNTADSFIKGGGLLKKIETSNPSELTEVYLKQELRLSDAVRLDKPGFTRPRAPGRRR